MNQHILIVDDIMKNIQLLAATLDSAGYEVSFASNGQKALEAVDELIPDLILLDINMPVMDVTKYAGV